MEDTYTNLSKDLTSTTLILTKNSNTFSVKKSSRDLNMSDIDFKHTVPSAPSEREEVLVQVTYTKLSKELT